MVEASSESSSPGSVSALLYVTMTAASRVSMTSAARSVITLPSVVPPQQGGARRQCDIGIDCRVERVARRPNRSDQFAQDPPGSVLATADRARFPRATDVAAGDGDECAKRAGHAH